MKVICLLFVSLLCIVTSCTKEDLIEEQMLIPRMVEESDSVDTDSVNKGSDSDTIVCSYEKFMSLKPVGKHGAQGSACYEDYFIQGYNFNDCITIYNLKEKKCLGTIDIPAPIPSSKIHVNTVNFGNQRYSTEDHFPLLYVSSGYPIDGISFIYVYRIVKKIVDKKEVFSISLVQTISLYDFGNWTEGIADVQTNSLWIKYSKDGLIGFAYYKVPRIEEGDAIIFYEDSIKDFRLDKIPVGSRSQGHLFKDGKILLVAGVPSAGEDIAFISIDTEKEKREFIINLADVGLVNPNNPKDNTFEPEGVIIYNEQLMICYRKAIYSFNIERKKKDNLYSQNEKSNNIRYLRPASSRSY